jgi:hypothetical protein
MPIVRHADPDDFLAACAPALAHNAAAASLLRAIALGVKRCANPNAIYARIGYRSVSDFHHFDFVAPPSVDALR